MGTLLHVRRLPFGIACLAALPLWAGCAPSLIDACTGRNAPAICSAFGFSPGFQISAGDFNLDGNTDVVTINSASTAIEFRAGTGSGSFGAAQTTTVGSSPMGVASADFNSDGKLDVAVANFGSNTVGIYSGSGTGTFTLTSTVSSGSGPAGLTAGDFNKDGKVDLAVTNASAGTVSILTGSGNGSFTSGATLTAGSGPLGIASVDLNNDGKLDLAVSNSGSGTLGVFLGTGTGSFGTQTTSTVGTNPSSIATADLNSDGKADLVVANAGANSVSVWIGNGSGGATSSSTLSAGSAPTGVAIADINTDSKLDVIVVNKTGGTYTYFLGTGSGTFGSAVSASAPSSVSGAVVADFNKDGKQDVLIASSASSVQVVTGTATSAPTGAFGAVTSVSIGGTSNPYGVAIGDLNNDGWNDIAIASIGDDRVHVYLNNGSGGFPSGTGYNLGGGAAPRSVAMGDFNGDGKKDIVVTMSGAAQINILTNNGSGTFTIGTAVNTTYASPRGICVGDWDQDGDLDVAYVQDEPAAIDRIGIMTNNGTGTLSVASNVALVANADPWTARVADFNHDGDLDLLVSYRGLSKVAVSLGGAAAAFGAVTTFNTPNVVVASNVGDFNLDGHLDIVAAIETAGKISLLAGDGAGSFAAAQSYTTVSAGTIPHDILAGDFDRDGKLDVVYPEQSSSTLQWFKGDGTIAAAGSLSSGSTVASGDTRFAELGDLNNDGKPDVVVADSGGQGFSIHLGQ